MATTEYIPRSERSKPPAEQAVIVLKELTIEDLVEIENHMTEADDKGNHHVLVGTTKLNKFLKGVSSWRNVLHNGQPLDVSEGNKRLLPGRWFTEIVQAINDLSVVSEDQEGK